MYLQQIASKNMKKENLDILLYLIQLLLGIARKRARSQSQANSSDETRYVISVISNDYLIEDEYTAQTYSTDVYLPLTIKSKYEKFPCLMGLGNMEKPVRGRLG